MSRIIGPIFMKLAPIDSSRNDAQVHFWDDDDRTKRSAGNELQPFEDTQRHLWTASLRPNAWPDWIGAKRLSIEHFKTYQTI